MVKRFNIVRPKKYTSNGAEKTQWLPVGTLVQFEDGGYALELNHTSEKYKIFEQKPRGETKPPATVENATEFEPKQSEVNVDDIPF